VARVLRQDRRVAQVAKIQLSPAAPSLVAGVGMALRGLKVALASPEVRRVYLQLAGALVLTSLVLAAGLGWLVWRFFPVPEDMSSLRELLTWGLRIAGMILATLAAPLLALFVVNIVFPFLGERVFMAGLRVVDPARADELMAAEGLGFSTSVLGSVRRLVYFVGVTLLVFALTLVPLLGTLLGPFAQLWFTARMLSWELLDPYFERRGLVYAEQRALLRQQRATMFGFGTPYTLLLALPIVGPLGFGLAQAAAALLVSESLEPRDAENRVG
jgi:CysZ protein